LHQQSIRRPNLQRLFSLHGRYNSFSTSLEEHLLSLRKEFAKLQEANLKL